jgi:AcrR family transcriptional regulator
MLLGYSRTSARRSPLAHAPPRNPDSLYFRHLDLSDGRDGMRAASVASQRARLLDAVNRAVATKGYAKVTVSDIVSLAQVSRRTFYEQFADKEECFLEAYWTGSIAVIEDIADAVRASDSTDWRERVRIGFAAYTATLSAEPDLTRTLLVEVLAAGPRAIDLRRRVLERFGVLFLPAPGASRPSDETLRGVPEAYVRGLVGAISELVQEHIFVHGAETLTDLTPTLVEVACTLLEAGVGPARVSATT